MPRGLCDSIAALKCMDFYLTTPDIIERPNVLSFFERLKQIAFTEVGFCYYKYPLAGGNDQEVPDIVIADVNNGIIAFDFYAHSLGEISAITDSCWTVGGSESDAPVLKLEDYETNLRFKFQKYRALRDKIQFRSFVVLPAISREAFEKKFHGVDTSNILFEDYLGIPYEAMTAPEQALDGQMVELFLAVAQGAGRLNSYKAIGSTSTADTIGEAIGLLENRISSLERMQHAAAIQIPDGPQRIRGLAGTGKTIVLAMKAAILHSRFPEKKILYTFHTQSLYNHIRNLITKFYRESEEKDPNWDNLLVLHSWGSRSKEGVYYRTCLRNSVIPVRFDEARNANPEDPLAHVCTDLLKHRISEEFDYVLIDEGQDLPPAFYQAVWHSTKSPKRITFAYDELQSLTKLQIADTGELFGLHKDGSKRVDFSKGFHPGGIEMDFPLKRSYRNPLDILLVAHGIGLGIYNKTGEMQIIEDQQIWEAIGYVIEEGTLQKGSKVLIRRPLENSASFIHEIYKGNSEMILTQRFESRLEEISWVANSIQHDVQQEKIPPHQIVVICLNSGSLKEVFPALQKQLFDRGIPSLAPGFDGIERSKFAEDGFVTLSTVFKAKGNEGFMLYVMTFDTLYDYTEFVRPRNRAFTSISRSKGWLRISGIGKHMDRAISELQAIRAHIPCFEFKFPDPANIKRKLSTEEFTRRIGETKRARHAIQALLEVDEGAVEKVSSENRRDLLLRLMGDLSEKEIEQLMKRRKR